MSLKTLYPFKVRTALFIILLSFGVQLWTSNGNCNECWNLVGVNATWKQRNSSGNWVKVSPRNLKTHLTTDGSWQWVEYENTPYPNGRLIINGGWSPPPGQYCSNSRVRISLKLSNRAINRKNRNNVANLSWGVIGKYGDGLTQIYIAHDEPGKTGTGEIRLHSGPEGSRGLAGWRAKMEIGNMRTGLRGTIDYLYSRMNGAAGKIGSGNSSAGRNANGFTSLKGNDDSFVRSLYYSILGRRPDEGGVKTWKNWLSQGRSREWVIAQFFNSQEYRNKRKSNAEYVKDLYRGVLGRKPDSGGMRHWLNQLSHGSSRQDVLNGFLRSKEYRMRTS